MRPRLQWKRDAYGGYTAKMSRKLSGLEARIIQSMTVAGYWGWTVIGDGYFVSSTSDKYRTAQSAKQSCERALVAICNATTQYFSNEESMNHEEPLPPRLEERATVKVPTKDDLENWFTYHPPTEEDIDKYLRVRSSALALARVIHEECPPGPDTSVAIRKVREAVMTANAAIACCGK